MANEMPVPPQQPIVTFFNPNRRDLGLVEIWSTERATDEPIDLGTPHPNTRDYPGFRLGLQQAILTDDGWWKRVWVTDETNPDWFNYEIKFAAEAIAFPTYIRQYRIDKKTYAPITKGLPLGSVIILKLGAFNGGGSGYTPGTFPVVTFSGGGGSGATGHAIVNLDGTIADLVLDDGGTGYTSAPTVAVEDPPIGLTATGTAVIQPQNAVLIAEQAEEFPKDSEFFGLYFNVTRVYETLPGPTLESTRLDDDGIVVELEHTRDVATSVASSEAINPFSGAWIKTTKKETGNLYVAERVVEIRALPGNIIPSAKVAADERIEYSEEILKDATTITPSATEAGGAITNVDQDAVTDLVSKEITKVKEWPPDLNFKVSIPDFIPARFRGIVPTTTRIHNEPGTAVLPVLGVGELERIESEVNDLLKRISVTDIGDVELPVVLTDTAIDKNCVETTLVFTFDLGEQTLNSGNDPTFSNGEVTHLGAGYTLMTEIFDTLPSCWRVSQKPDDDGILLQTRTRKNLTASITPGETIVAGVWTRISKEGENGTIADEVELTRTVPGNPMVEIKIDKDGKQRAIVKTLKDATTITAGEVITAGVWITTEKDPVSDLVANEIVTARDVPGNNVSSASVAGDHEVANVTTVLRDGSLITPSATEAGGFITTVEKKDVTDLVADQITTVKKFLDEKSFAISIPNLIPEWARAQIPTLVESHILSGTAAAPVLGVNEFSASEKQLTKLLYERRVEKIPDDVVFPVTATNQETTEEYGGGVLNVTVTLDDTALTVDEGLLVVSSETKTLAVYTGGPPDGLFMKETKELDDSSWPTLTGQEFDEETQSYSDIETEVVDPTYTPAAADYTVENIRAIDKWRSRRTKISKDVTDHSDADSALISYQYHPFQFPGTLDYARLITYDHREGFRRAAALLCKHTIRTWWINNASVPTVGDGMDVDVKEIITDTVNVPVFSAGTTTGAQTYPDVVHDDITNTLGASYPATTPSFTEYYSGTGSGVTGTSSLLVLAAIGTGYTVGDVLSVGGGAFSVTVLGIGASGSILNFSQPDPVPPGVIVTGYSAGTLGMSSTGGGGSGAVFNETIISWEETIPGSMWIGTEKVISATVKQTDIPNLWKVITESVVMR